MTLLSHSSCTLPNTEWTELLQLMRQDLVDEGAVGPFPGYIRLP